MSVLAELYHGNVNPSERFIKKSGEYGRLMEELTERMDECSPYPRRIALWKAFGLALRLCGRYFVARIEIFILSDKEKEKLLPSAVASL